MPRAAPACSPERAALQARWLALIRHELPSLARARGWPVSADHCFARILLDAACGGRWTDHIAGRPAYACASDAVLMEAVRLANACVAGTADLALLNRRSLAGRRRAGPRVDRG